MSDPEFTQPAENEELSLEELDAVDGGAITGQELNTNGCGGGNCNC